MTSWTVSREALQVMEISNISRSIVLRRMLSRVIAHTPRALMYVVSSHDVIAANNAIFQPSMLFHPAMPFLSLGIRLGSNRAWQAEERRIFGDKSVLDRRFSSTPATSILLFIFELRFCVLKMPLLSCAWRTFSCSRSC